MRSPWKVAALSEVATVALSGVDKHVLPDEAPVRLCNYLDVYRNRTLRKPYEFAVGSARLLEIERFRIKRGDVVITKDSETPDDIAVPCHIADDFENTICAYHLALIRPGERLDSRFLSCILQSASAKCYFLAKANGLTRFGLGARAIASFPVPLPERREQSAIADIFDAMDAAIESTRTAIEKAKRLKRGLMQNLFSVGVDAGGVARNAKNKHQFRSTPLGRFPVDWELSDVNAEFDIGSGFTLGEHRRPRMNRRKYLRVANVQREYVALEDVAELEAAEREMKGRTLEADDLLVVEGHADPDQIGRCAIVPEGAAGMTFQNHLFRLRSRRLDPLFAMLWLNSMVCRRYWRQKCSTSSGLNTINQRKLKRLPVAVPPKPEQERIAQTIQASTDLISRTSEELLRLERLKRGLMQDLLTGRKRILP